MSAQTVTPIDVKQQIHQVVELLPPQQLPNLLHFSKTLLNGKSANDVNGADPLSNQASETEHPSMKFAGIFKDDPYWDEFLECLAEVRREGNEDDEVI